MNKINLFRFYRMDYCIRNLGLGIMAILTVDSVPNPFNAFLAMIQILLIQMHSFSTNNYFDYKVWKEDNYIGKLLTSNFNQKILPVLCLAPLLFLAITIPFSDKYFFLLILYIFLFSLYQIPPFRNIFKNHYLSSIIINSICLGTILYLYPYLYLNKELHLVGFLFSLIFFFYLAFHEVIHQIAHLGQDKIYSLPQAIGIKKAVKVAISFLIISILVAFYGFVISPLRNFFFSGTIGFSLFRIYKLSKIPLTKESFLKIKNSWDKFYSLQEGIYYLIVILLIKLWK